MITTDQKRQIRQDLFVILKTREAWKELWAHVAQYGVKKAYRGKLEEVNRVIQILNYIGWEYSLEKGILEIEDIDRQLQAGRSHVDIYIHNNYPYLLVTWRLEVWKAKLREELRIKEETERIEKETERLSKECLNHVLKGISAVVEEFAKEAEAERVLKGKEAVAVAEKANLPKYSLVAKVDIEAFSNPKLYNTHLNRAIECLDAPGLLLWVQLANRQEQLTFAAMDEKVLDETWEKPLTGLDSKRDEAINDLVRNGYLTLLGIERRGLVELLFQTEGKEQ